MSEWNFDQDKNCAAIISKDILSGSPTLYVFHDLEDHGWQFLSINELSPDNVAVVSMEQAVAADPTLHSISHLEVGHKASRKNIDEEWIIEPNI